MLAGQRLRDLAAARRLLVLQGDLHRSLLRLEGAALRERFVALAVLRRKLGVGRPLAYSGAVLAALLAARRWRGLVRWAPAALAAYRWLRRFPGK